MSITEEKLSELYLPTFVSTLDADDLKNIHDGLTSSESEGNELGLAIDEFCELLSTVLSKGNRNDYAELFNIIDISREGYLNWERFSSHLLLEYYEKEYRVKHSKVPQWVDLKYVTVPHRTCICKIMCGSLSYRYCTVSKDGMMCLMDGNFKLMRTSQVATNPEEIRPKDLWVTDAILMQNVNKIAFSNTSKEILIYDLATKTEFNCNYKIHGLKYIPLCITYWSNPNNVNHAMLAFGDVNGGVHVLFFVAATMSLFDKPLKDSDQQICFELNLNDVISGKFKSVSYMSFDAHSAWVRQISYQPFLDCFISSSTTTKDSMVLSWLGKARNDSRVTKFAISIGINGFDYHERMCLIATAGINNHICLWNPYVVSKPVGRLEGHVQVVVSVQFIGVNSQLISFAKDNVLRVWDANNQSCLQTLTGVFPRSLNADFFMIFDKERSSLVASFNHQLVVMKKKIELKNRVISHTSPVTNIIYNEKFGQIISVCEGSCITIWLLSTGQKVKQINNAHGDAEITAITIDHSETHILTGGTDGMIKRWDINGNCFNVFIVDGGNPCEINEIIYLKRTILAFGWSKMICCFSITQLNSYYVYPINWKGKQHHFDDILAADFAEPKHLVTASYDGDIVFWNTSTQNSSRKIANSKTRAVSLPPITTSPSIESLSVQSSSRQNSSRQNSSRLRCRSVSRKQSLVGRKDSFIKPSSPHALLRSPDRSLRSSNNLAVTSIAFLKTRDNRYPRTGDIYSCHADGYIRFWNSLTCKNIGEFVAFDQCGSIASCVDSSNQYLGVGGETGVCKIWNISDYCLDMSSDVSHVNHSSPIIVSSFIAHIDAITCTKFIDKRDLLLFVTASCDCSIALYNFSTLIGVFGQQEHWNINDQQVHGVLSHESTSDVEDAVKELGIGSQCTDLEVESGLFETELKADVPIKFDEPVTDDIDYLSSEFSVITEDCRFEVWDKTVLGKAYQEERKSKRDRKQPYDLSAISTGISTDKQTRSYRYLETKPIHEVTTLEKPEFMTHPEKFFFKKEDDLEESIPLTIDNLKLRHDEKTIFPKHVIDKMKHSGRSALNRPSVFVRLSVLNRGLSKPKDGWVNIVREAMCSTKIAEE